MNMKVVLVLVAFVAAAHAMALPDLKAVRAIYNSKLQQLHRAQTEAVAKGTIRTVETLACFREGATQESIVACGQRCYDRHMSRFENNECLGTGDNVTLSDDTFDEIIPSFDGVTPDETMERFCNGCGDTVADFFSAIFKYFECVFGSFEDEDEDSPITPGNLGQVLRELFRFFCIKNGDEYCVNLLSVGLDDYENSTSFVEAADSEKCPILDSIGCCMGNYIDLLTSDTFRNIADDEEAEDDEETLAEVISNVRQAREDCGYEDVESCVGPGEEREVITFSMTLPINYTIVSDEDNIEKFKKGFREAIAAGFDVKPPQVAITGISSAAGGASTKVDFYIDAGLSESDATSALSDGIALDDAVADIPALAGASLTADSDNTDAAETTLANTADDNAATSAASSLVAVAALAFAAVFAA